MTLRELSELTGKIISTMFTIENITHLKTGNIYKTIESWPSWDSKFNLSIDQKTINEIIFSRNNIKIISKRFKIQNAGYF